MDKVEILNAVLADPNRSGSEKEIARLALQGLGPLVDQEKQDHHIELWFAPRSERCTSRDKIDARKQFDAQTDELLYDLTDCPYLGCPPADGAEERLKALLDRTQSEIVRQHVMEALKSIAWVRSQKAGAV